MIVSVSLLLLLAVAARPSAAVPPFRRELAAQPPAQPPGPGRTLSELRESELERYAFLMLDPAASGVGDPIPAGTVTRRITPKSVFIAPSINGDQCAEGYQQDDMGRCVKVVKVDAEKSWDLLLDKLNNQFASDFDPVPESTAPPGPPPGPLQVAIPIAEGPASPSESEVPSLPQDGFVAVSYSSTTRQTELPSDVADVSTSSSVEETTITATERYVAEVPSGAGAQGDTALVPEVVMVSSEEYLQPLPHSGGQSTELIDFAALASAVLSSDQKNATNTDSHDTNPIINTVNRSPLVARPVTDGSNPQTATSTPDTSSQNSSPTPSSTSEVTEESPISPSTTWFKEVTAAEVPSSTPVSAIVSSSTIESVRESPSPARLPVENEASTSTELTPTSSTTLVSISSSFPTTQEVASSYPSFQLPSSSPVIVTESSSSSQSSSSSEEDSIRQGPVGNRLRPSSPLTSRIPVLAPEVVRFPTEKPTLFRTAAGTVRFPTIDVTFPTGSGPGSSKSDANGLREKPVKFPKDDQVNLWRLPPPASLASNWRLEQTRNKPYLFRYWSRSPSRLSPASFSDSLGLSSGSSSVSSSSSRDSLENVSGPSLWPPVSASSPYSLQASQPAPSRPQHTGNSFEFRRSSTSYSAHPHLGQSHRRGRDW